MTHSFLFQSLTRMDRLACWPVRFVIVTTIGSLAHWPIDEYNDPFHLVCICYHDESVGSLADKYNDSFNLVCICDHSGPDSTNKI